MNKICINGRDELMMLDLNKVACLKADTNYTTVYYMGGMTATIAMGLNKLESIIVAVPKSTACDFVRVGRSYIVNQAYLYQIFVLRQRLVLSDGVNQLSFTVTKEALKRYKQYIANKRNDGREKAMDESATSG